MTGKKGNRTGGGAYSNKGKKYPLEQNTACGKRASGAGQWQKMQRSRMSSKIEGPWANEKLNRWWGGGVGVSV